MLWTPDKAYRDEPFEREADLEAAILRVAPALFGPDRLYLDPKRRIGAAGRTRNVPDAYLLDLSSAREPKLYVVENELARHDPLKHIAVQILEFSLSFESSPQLVKTIVREALVAKPDALKFCQRYVAQNGFENVDYLLERVIYGPNRFHALVIIDELVEELETVLISRFKFPVEILTLERYADAGGETVFRFEPFLADVGLAPPELGANTATVTVDPSDLDTVVVPARAEGFAETFLGENCWHHIRMHSTMIPKIKYVAAYRVAPEQAITHVAPVSRIEQWQDSSKYILYFSEPPREIGPIRLVPNGRVKAPYTPRYTSLAKLQTAKTLDEAF